MKRPTARAHAAKHFDVAPERVEIMTSHVDFSAAVIARFRVQNRHVSLPDTVEIRTCPTPAGERRPWMLVAILPVQEQTLAAA